MDDANRLFDQGRANPGSYGFISLRSSAGEAPDPQRLEALAARLGRSVCFVDESGYECELIGTALGEAGDVAYVESRAKDAGGYVDISIRIHWIDPAGRHESADIQSYNPFFGCDVRLFEWIGKTAILIYREKHRTYACRFGDLWPPRFVKIEDRWTVVDTTLSYMGYKAPSVRRLTFPQLDELPPIPAAEAQRLGLLPPDPYAP